MRPRRLHRKHRLRPARSRTVVALRLAIGALILLSIPVGLECFARILAGVTGVSEEFNRVDEPELVTAYRLDIRTPQGLSLASTPPTGQLLATFHPLLGYRLTPDRRTQYWSINNSGFRDDEAISTEKPEGEIRIAILGGSMAFGQLSSSNDSTIAEQLETLLNDRVARQQDTPDEFQPERLPFFADRVSEVLARPPRIRAERYRVLNAAVPGYSSSNELAWYVQYVVAYDPDIVVILNGYADAISPGDRLGAEGVDIDRLAADAQTGLGQLVGQEMKTWLGNLTLVRGFDYYVLSAEPQPAWRSAFGLNQLASPSGSTVETATTREPNARAEGLDRDFPDVDLPLDEREQQRRLDRYRNALQQIVQLTSGTNSQLLIAVQPELTGRDPQVLAPTEREIALALGTTYRNVMPKLFQQLGTVAEEVTEASDDAEAITLYGELNELNEEAFRSPDSLTDAGNAVVAERLFDELTQMLAIFPRPFDPNRDRRR